MWCVNISLLVYAGIFMHMGSVNERHYIIPGTMYQWLSPKCRNSIANALELPQSCTKSSISVIVLHHLAWLIVLSHRQCFSVLCVGCLAVFLIGSALAACQVLWRLSGQHSGSRGWDVAGASPVSHSCLRPCWILIGYWPSESRLTKFRPEWNTFTWRKIVLWFQLLREKCILIQIHISLRSLFLGSNWKYIKMVAGNGFVLHFFPFQSVIIIFWCMHGIYIPLFFWVTSLVLG